MAQGPGTDDEPTGPTGIVKELTIYMNTQKVDWAQLTIKFDEVVEAWDKHNPDQTVLSTLPGIEWNLPGKAKKILYRRDDPIPVVDQMEFRIDTDYLS